jgi:hypothetical protein
MKRRLEPPPLLAVRRRTTEGRGRIARQQRRVARIEREGRDATHASALLEKFLSAQAKREQFLHGLLKHIERNPHA